MYRRGSGFHYTKQLCLCVIKFHVSVNIQSYADVRMPHDILQCLWVHSGFRHIGAEGVSAYMGGYFEYLDAVDFVVLLDNVLELFLQVQCYHRSTILIQKQEAAVPIYHGFSLGLGIFPVGKATPLKGCSSVIGTMRSPFSV